MLNLIVQIVSALVAYLKYRFDPDMIKRRDEIHKQISEDSGHEEIDRAMAQKDTLKLSYFVSEFLRRKRVRNEEADSASGRAADLLIGVLPKPRDEKSRHEDSAEGFGDG